MDDSNAKLLNLIAAASYLGVSQSTISRLMRSGDLEVVRLRVDPFITRKSLDALVEKRATRVTPPVAPTPANRRPGRRRKHDSRATA